MSFSMISSEVLAIVYGLASAASWGTGDFSGGVATKRNNVYSVVILSQLVGGILLIALAFLLAERIPSLDNLLFGAIAGISGAFGLVALYTGLARGRMGIVAPVAAVVTAALPVVVSILNEGFPSAWQLVGFGIAFLAVWFLSRDSSDAPIRARELSLPVTAGLGFGLFFILIDRVSNNAILWPLVAARVASTSILSVFVTVRRQGEAPAINQLLIIVLAGIFDTGGNAFFALATRAGRLDVSAVLASLYPATTVLLAWFILKERLVPWQWVGVIAALVALVFIAS
jgi:drug/metabolite transporter (DMT)-like permease